MSVKAREFYWSLTNPDLFEAMQAYSDHENKALREENERVHAQLLNTQRIAADDMARMQRAERSLAELRREIKMLITDYDNGNGLAPTDVEALRSAIEKETRP